MKKKKKKKKKEIDQRPGKKLRQGFTGGSESK